MKPCRELRGYAQYGPVVVELIIGFKPVFLMKEQ